MLRKCIDYLGPIPTFHDLWTYCGLWITCGAITGMTYRLVFADLLGWTHWMWWGISATCGVALVTLMLVAMAKFSWGKALVIAIGALCIALPNWLTFKMEFALWQSVALTIGGILISLPPFSRRMVELRKLGLVD